MKKIVITGGHLTPALAVISTLEKSGNWEIYYFGRKTSMEGDKTPSAEFQIIPARGVNFVSLNTGRFQRHFTKYTIPSLLRIPFGIFQSFWYLIKIKPKVVCSFGGYVSVPVVIASWFLRIPVLTHEQTVVFGLASRINSFFASKIAVSFSQSLDFFTKGKAVLTGNPIRDDIFENIKPEWLKESRKPIIYVTGGSQGSIVINKAVIKNISKLLEDYLVIHQTGQKDFEDILKFKTNLPHDLGNNYEVLPFVDSKDIGWILKNSTLIISRAGANTVCEIGALGKMALFIPLPFAYQDEQTKNAQMLKNVGTAEILNQNDLDKDDLFLNLIQEMICEKEKYQNNSQKAKDLILKDAQTKIVKELENLA